MIAVTLSSKYQLALPKAIRDELGLHAGQKFALITKGSVIELVPLRPIEKSRGLLKGANPEGVPRPQRSLLMEVLVDTCGWIEWLTDGVLAERFCSFLTEPESLIVPTCLQFELYKWVKRERNETLAMEIMALTNQTQVIPLTTALALYAADLSLAHRLSFADALIYATARRYEVTLVTIDDHFAGLTDVTYFPKRLLSEP